MKVEFLYFEGCPGHVAAFSLLRQAVAEEDGGAELVAIEVPSPEAAEAHRFVGSPTIRIDGVDLEGPEVEASQGYGWRCRYYEDSEPDQPKAVPSAELIRRRLRERISEVAKDESD
jgi:hypothetical protein